MAPRTRYARSGDLSIAYQVVGDGPVDLVHAPPYVSHLEYAWEEPSYAHYLERLAAFSRLILFDKRGTGLSDRVAGIAPLAERMDDVRAVMDAAESERAVLYGMSESTPLSILFAATYPERTSALVLYAAYASEVQAPDYPWAPTSEELGVMLAERARTIHEEWGSGHDLAGLTPTRMHDPTFRTWFSTFQRLSASPGAVIALDRMNAIIDVRHVLPAIHVPTLVLHRTGTGEAIIGAGRYVADHIPGAWLIELPGTDYLPYVGDTDALVDEIEAFVTGSRPTAIPNAVLATVLTLEIVDAADRAIALGDRGWHDLQVHVGQLVRRELNHFRGQQQEVSEDRLVATFDGPVRALHAAKAITSGVRALGLMTRAGVHTGECRLENERVSGAAVPLTAWVARQAGPHEILVSSTVRDLVAGAGLHFVDRGVHEVGAGAGEWRLYELRDDGEGGPAAPQAVERSLHQPAAFGLSPREGEVLKLVAAGQSNAEIAAELFISVSTVKRHVSTILGKLNLPSRPAAVAFAHTHGLA